MRLVDKSNGFVQLHGTAPRAAHSDANQQLYRRDDAAAAADDTRDLEESYLSQRYRFGAPFSADDVDR